MSRNQAHAGGFGRAGLTVLCLMRLVVLTWWKEYLMRHVLSVAPVAIAFVFLAVLLEVVFSLVAGF